MSSTLDYFTFEIKDLSSGLKDTKSENEWKRKSKTKHVHLTFASNYISAVYQNQFISVCFTVYLLKIYLNPKKM